MLHQPFGWMTGSGRAEEELEGQHLAVLFVWHLLGLDVEVADVSHLSASRDGGMGGSLGAA